MLNTDTSTIFKCAEICCNESFWISFAYKASGLILFVTLQSFVTKIYRTIFCDESEEMYDDECDDLYCDGMYCND
jgi:hypothetical protein